MQNNPLNYSNLVAIVRSWLDRQPNKCVYTFLANGEAEAGSLTYEQLDRKARSIAGMLQSLNAKGECALLLYQPGLDYVAAFIGCLYAGVIAVPAYPPHPSRSLSRMLSIITDAQPRFALTTAGITAAIKERFSATPGLKELRCLGTDEIADDFSGTWTEPNIGGDTIAFLQYTSGSTAAPKGVTVSHGNLLANQKMIKRAMGHSEKLQVVSWLPPYHDMGLIGSLLQPLCLGGHCVFMPPVVFLQKPYRWLKAISDFKAHSSGGPNFAYDLCVHKITAEQRETLDLSDWHVAYNGAEPVRHDTLSRFIEAFEPCGFRRQAFYPCYGLAEATLIVSGGLKSAPPVFMTVDKVPWVLKDIIFGSAGVTCLKPIIS